MAAVVLSRGAAALTCQTGSGHEGVKSSGRLNRHWSYRSNLMPLAFLSAQLRPFVNIAAGRASPTHSLTYLDKLSQNN